MAKISMKMSFTINFISREIEFSKVEAEISDVDLEQDFDAQLGNFDVVSNKVYILLKNKLAQKIKMKAVKERIDGAR